MDVFIFILYRISYYITSYFNHSYIASFRACFCILFIVLEKVVDNLIIPEYPHGPYDKYKERNPKDLFSFV